MFFEGIYIMSNTDIQKSNVNTKKKKRNKIIALSVICVAVVSFIAVIMIYLLGGYDSVIGTKDGKYEPIKSSKEDSKTVGKIDGFNVKYEELKYVAFVVKERYEALYGEDVWENAEKIAMYKDAFEAEVMRELCDIYATLSICDGLKIKTGSDEVNKYVDAQMEEIIDKDFHASLEEYNEYLEKYNLTDSLNRFKIKCYYLDILALDKMVDDGHEIIKYSDRDVNAFVDYVTSNDDFYRTIHVYFEKDGKNDDDIRFEAGALVSDMKAISDDSARYERMCYFIGHRGDYKEGYVTDTKAGFYITDGVFGDEYDTAARSVEEYGVTLVETEYGFFVVMRMPKEKAHVSQNLEGILAYYYEKTYFDYRSNVAKSLTFKPNKYYETLDILNLD